MKFLDKLYTVLKSTAPAAVNANKNVQDTVPGCGCNDGDAIHDVLIHESFEDRKPTNAKLCMFHIEKKTSEGYIISMVKLETK